MKIRHAASGLIVSVIIASAMSSASAETLELVCTYETIFAGGSSYPWTDQDLHVSVDSVARTVKESTGADNGQRAYPASISESVIKWEEPFATQPGWSYKYQIDRSTGNIIYEQFYQGGLHSTTSGKCNRATQKF